MDLLAVLSIIIVFGLDLLSAFNFFTGLWRNFSDGVVAYRQRGFGRHDGNGGISAIVFNLNFNDNLGKMTPWIALAQFGWGSRHLLFQSSCSCHINLRADHIVSGTVINMLAPALAVFLTKVLYEGKGQTAFIVQNFGKTSFPVLKDIPVKIGDTSRTHRLAYAAIKQRLSVTSYLFKTTFGLRLRSVGEHPQAADTLGINVYVMRYAGVLGTEAFWVAWAAPLSPSRSA